MNALLLLFPKSKLFGELSISRKMAENFVY